MEIESLTKYTGSGELYKRPKKVVDQLETIIQQTSAQLIERARIPDKNDPSFILEECLVYMVKHYNGLQQRQMVDELSELLIRRSAKRIQYRLRSLEPSDPESAYVDVISSLFIQILDKNGKGDFFQIKYFSALQKITIGAYRKYQRHGSITTTFANFETDVDELFEDSIVESVDSSAILSPELIYQNNELVEQALRDLDESIQKVFILRHVYGWPLSSKDPKKRTISKHMNVTPKTVYNWLKDAEKHLMQWRNEYG